MWTHAISGVAIVALTVYGGILVFSRKNWKFDGSLHGILGLIPSLGSIMISLGGITLRYLI